MVFRFLIFIEQCLLLLLMSWASRCSPQRSASKSWQASLWAALALERHL